MGIEGLDFILNKKEVIPTVSASDLLNFAERVENDYLRHVRTYVPISRAAEGQDGVMSVGDFERRVIKAVKEARAPRGYLTAEYGYGKTSTALYLWQRAEQSGLVTVPPFQMLQLQDLITATHGWVRYRLSVQMPSLITELDALYQDTTGRSLEQEARSMGTTVAALEERMRQGRFYLELQPSDYILYFEKVTDIVLRAGYQGLLMLPDEIQQYIEPRVQRTDDPIAPLFNLVQQIATRDGYLKFGFIMVIPLKEIGVIREARGRDDLLHRMRVLSLDLTSVYDFDFAIRLWNLLADEFKFKDVSPEIVTPEALEALGEVASREDLSNGPRTVINTFRRMVERYKTHGSRLEAYTPIDFIDDLLGGAIQFTGNNQIQNVTRRALQNAIIRSNPERYERAVKLAAAYPGAGVPIHIQQKYRVADALEELMQQALGELVIAVGPIDLRGVTLFGLQVGQQQNAWLPQTIRDFRRAYGEHHATTKERVLKVFSLLLKKKVFNGWNVIEERRANYTSNHSLILEGDFQSFASRYPKRRVHVRIFWEDEELKDADTYGDVAIHYHLSAYPELKENSDERRKRYREVEMIYGEHTAVIPINLMYVRADGVPLQIQQALQGVWSPYDLSPLVLMNIYQMLEEKRAENLIPRQDDQYIASGFQPDLLDTVMRDLFNSQVGSSLGGVAQNRITEVAAELQLDHRYRDTYSTLMAQSTWKSSLQRYSGAIDKLGNLYQKRGEIEVEGTKKEIADLMTYSNTALDNFIKTFSGLMTISREWRGNDAGAVKFTLHDLETKIIHWLRGSRTESVSVGGKRAEVHVINTNDVFNRARVLGYQNDEIDELLKLLAKRGMLEIHQQHLIRELPSQTVDLDGVVYQLNELRRDVDILLRGFPGNASLTPLKNAIEQWQQAIDQERQTGTPDAEGVYRLGRNIQFRQSELRNFATDRQEALSRQFKIMGDSLRPISQQYLNVLDSPIVGSVSFVHQINALSRAVHAEANKVKGMVDRLKGRMEKSLADIREQNISYETLARCANELSDLEEQTRLAKSQLDNFDGFYQHLNAWRSLVAAGSELNDDLQRMGKMVSTQNEAFDNIVREISGRISSEGNKLTILPDHSIFSSRLQTLRTEVNRIRLDAENAFIDLQNRYIQSLTAQGLYKREQVGRPLTYNLSSPDESYRLLFENVQRLTRDLCTQMQRVISSLRQGVQTTLDTPLLQNLPLDDREKIEAEGQGLLTDTQDLLSTVSNIDNAAENIANIQDFGADGTGVFGQMVTSFLQIRDDIVDVNKRAKKIDEWLTHFELTPEEKIMMEHLPQEGLDSLVDLVDWSTNVPLTRDQFWQAVRSLYEKRCIRLHVSGVRR